MHELTVRQLDDAVEKAWDEVLKKTGLGIPGTQVRRLFALGFYAGMKFERDTIRGEIFPAAVTENK